MKDTWPARLSQLPKIGKPRPVKFCKPELLQMDNGLWFVAVRIHRLGGERYGPLRKTQAAAIRAWNKQEGRA